MGIINYYRNPAGNGLQPAPNIHVNTISYTGHEHSDWATSQIRQNIAKIFCLLFYLLFTTQSYASDAHKSEHGNQIFHSFKLETDIGANRDSTMYTWDFDGWIGNDENKLRLKSEGEKEDGKPSDQSEFWAMYSRNISTFWDAQIGIRFDEQPAPTTYFVTGLSGLAPYFIDVETHVFLSEDGDITARLRKEKDFLITQTLIIKPYTEINFSAQDVTEQAIGTGLTKGDFGIQTRYEITRKFAPYIDLRYERKLGETSAIALKNYEKREDAILSVGVRVMF